MPSTCLSWLPPSLQGKPLTEREEQVLTMLAVGLPHKSIAVILEIAVGTVSMHKLRIGTKLGLNSEEQWAAHLKSLR